MPAFKQAITDTIKAIGTGIWQTRDGRELGRLRSRHEFQDESIRNGLAETERALAALRADEGPSNTIHHIAFRVGTFQEVKYLASKLEPLEGIEIQPLTHGNALSIYFNDPEGNGLEVFWDTPWHVQQPMVRPWDISMDEQQALEWIESEFADAPEFCSMESYKERRRAEVAQA